MRSFRFENEVKGDRTSVLLIGAGVFFAALLLGGCAVGRGPAGEIVLGIEAGRLVDTVEQGIIGAAGMIPGAGPLIQQLLLSAAAGGATVAGTGKLVLNRVESRRKTSDQAREEAERDLAVATERVRLLEARLNGQPA